MKRKVHYRLPLGAARVRQEEIYAIDPHKILPEEKYFEDTEAEFFANIKQAGIDSQLAPMIMTSEEAARGWNKPIRLLWIDGDHRHESTKLEFALWEPHVVEGGILAMHDTIKKKGPKRVLWEPCFARVAFKKLPLSTASLLLGLHRCIW